MEINIDMEPQQIRHELLCPPDTARSLWKTIGGQRAVSEATPKIKCDIFAKLTGSILPN